MRAWLRVRSKPGPLFPSRLRHGINRRTIGLLMKRYSILAGIPPDKAHPHALKHYALRT